MFIKYRVCIHALLFIYTKNCFIHTSLLEMIHKTSKNIAIIAFCFKCWMFILWNLVECSLWIQKHYYCIIIDRVVFSLHSSDQYRVRILWFLMPFLYEFIFSTVHHFAQLLCIIGCNMMQCLVLMNTIDF